uniref:Ig-like domain-containing protein n=1 Tax=Neogobius melanostomus TaxID=47308 RepID=A0A8C6SHQ3_9GOBI
FILQLLEVQLMLSLCLACAANAEDKIPVIEAAQGQNVSLPCTAGSKKGVDYWACRWYKEGVDPRLSGLVSRSPPLPSLSLLLPPVTCSDSGVYQCYMAAPVGEQNREGRVGLRVMDCPVDVVTAVLNQQELPVLTTALVLFAVLGTTLTCLCLRKAKWNKAKSVENPVYPDLSYPLEKWGLIPLNFTVVQNLKTSPPGFNSV